jgi:DNA-binding XRE family transcriptional regulator
MGVVSEPRTQKNGEKNAMDMWDFLKWRKTLRFTQAEAAEKLGVNRGTIQNWERGVTRISKAAELACQELTRFWKQRSEFGPVALIYADGPIWQQAESPSNVSVLQCQRFLNNDAAIEQALRLKRTPHFINPVIMDKSGGVVWTSPELLSECDRRAKEARAKREAAERAANNQNTGPPKGSRRESDEHQGEIGRSESDINEHDNNSSDT